MLNRIEKNVLIYVTRINDEKLCLKSWERRNLLLIEKNALCNPSSLGLCK